jgi:galactonate dehydratase
VKIVSVRPLVMGTPWRNLTFVAVGTDEGVDGVGEVRMVNHTEALLGLVAEAVPTHVIGSDPFAIESVVQRLDKWRPHSVEDCLPRSTSGTSGVEVELQTSE